MEGPAAGFRRLLDTMNRLNIPYMVAGSLASSIHGITRATRDVDLVADVRPEQVAPLAAALQPEFYADPEMMREALDRGRSFNLIHYASSYKFDIFPLLREPYQQAQFARRTVVEYFFEGQTAAFFVASAEDTILMKLAWYQAGNRVSEAQWSDVLDVIRVKRDVLDLAYLRKWAGPLGVADLLAEALSVG